MRVRSGRRRRHSPSAAEEPSPRAMALEESLRRSNARFMATINSILERVRAARAAAAVGWRKPLAAASCFRRRPEAGLAGALCQRRDLQAAAARPHPRLSEGRRALLRSLLPKWCAARPGRPCASLCPPLSGCRAAWPSLPASPGAVAGLSTPILPAHLLSPALLVPTRSFFFPYADLQ